MDIVYGYEIMAQLYEIFLIKKVWISPNLIFKNFISNFKGEKTKG